MKGARTVCLLCRARLSARVAPGHGGIAGGGLDSRALVVRPRWHGVRPLTTDTAAASTGEPVRTAGPQPPRMAAKQPRRRKRPQPTDDAALAVFRDIVQGDKDKEEKKEKKKQHAPPALYDQLVKLTQMRSQPDASVAALFAFFEAELYPHMAAAPRELPNLFILAAQQLVRDVTAAKQRDYLRPDLPSVARITHIRRQLDLLNMPQPWAALAMGLLDAIYRQTEAGSVSGSAGSAGSAGSVSGCVGSVSGSASGSASDSASSGNPPTPDSATLRHALLDDLVQAWRLFCLPDMVVADPVALARAGPTAFRLPTPDPALLDKYAWRGNLNLAVALLFPRYVPRQLPPLLPAVLASYAFLTDPAVATPDAARTAKAFLDAVAHILRAVPVDRQTVADMFVAAPDLGSYVLARWPLVTPAPDRARMRPPPSASASSPALPRAQRPNAAALAAADAAASEAVLMDSIHSQISQALRARNLDACEAAWSRFWAALSVPDAEGAERLRRSAEMFDYFIMAFTTMRMPNRAIAVWNLMAMAGVQPTLRTWTSFMEGCKLASNPTGIHNIWAKLMASGLPVDTAVWTARISGLILAGEAEAGIQALEEMQQVWEAAQAEGSTATAVRPTVEPVNAAIAGLLRRGDLAAAKRILAWAGRHGIEPDMITFNTILRPLVREGRGDEVAGLLEMMRRRGLQPDEATVTILLDGTLGGGALAGRSPAAKVDVVRQVLAAVEAAGLQANHQTYAKMLHLLLLGDPQPGAGGGRSSRGGGGPSHPSSTADALDAQGTDAAVQVVFDRMRQRDLPLSSHICTILAEHYFAQRPPDLDAVQALIDHSHTPPPLSPSAPRRQPPASSSSSSASALLPAPPPFLDRVFWERVVRGYAQVGDTARALQHYAHIAGSLSVTMSTLEDLLRALIRNGEWAAAEQLVAKAQAQATVQLARGQGGEEALAAAAKAVAGAGTAAGTGAGAGASGTAARRGGSVADARQFRHRFWHLAAEYGLLQRQQ